VAEGELRVVEAEEVEDGGVEVMDVDGVLDDLGAEVVGLAVGDAALDAAAGEPGAEGGVVVAAAVAAVDGGRAAELRGPDDQRVVEHAA
jgi:hypothetical protein